MGGVAVEKWSHNRIPWRAAMLTQVLYPVMSGIGTHSFCTAASSGHSLTTCRQRPKSLAMRGSPDSPPECLCFAPTPFPVLPAPKRCSNHIACAGVWPARGVWVPWWGSLVPSQSPPPPPSDTMIREEPSSHVRMIITLHLIDISDILLTNCSCLFSASRAALPVLPLPACLEDACCSLAF